MILDHVAFTNHIIEWERAEVLHCEDECYPRWIRESIWRKRWGAQSYEQRGHIIPPQSPIQLLYPETRAVLEAPYVETPALHLDQLHHS